MATAQETLAVYESARDSLLAGTVAQVTIGEQSFTRLELTTIERMIDKYRALAAKEVARAAGRSRFSVVRFG